MDKSTVYTANTRKITFTATAARFGRVVYQVDNIGAFTIAPSGSEPTQGNLYLRFGRATDDQMYWEYHGITDRPVINGVQLDGGTEFAPAAADPDHADWLSVNRDIGPYGGIMYAPKATAKRTADLVHALVADYLSRPDFPELADAALRHHARRWREEHLRAMRAKQHAIVTASIEAAREHALATRCGLMCGEAPPPLPPVLPRPTTREGASIYQLHHKLAAMVRDDGSLNGGDVVTAVCDWFADINLLLPEG